jgi:5-methylcytosine-specific restriction endonuclease McrA
MRKKQAEGTRSARANTSRRQGKSSVKGLRATDIKRHLSTFSIVKKRTTTVRHAFASAVAPSEEYDAKKVEAALRALGQKDTDNLTCVYCGEPAKTWDHLTRLVKNKTFNEESRGHQVGNLVPCCKDHNSSKDSQRSGGKRVAYREFVNTLSMTARKKQELIARLDRHFQRAKKVTRAAAGTVEASQLAILEKTYNDIQRRVIRQLAKADKVAEQIRGLRYP